MKISISCSVQDTNSVIDDRFGRCNYFYIYDTASKKGEFFENSHKDGGHGVGTKIVEFLANKSVNEICAVEVGEKAKDLLQKLKIKINIVNKNIIVNDIINQYN